MDTLTQLNREGMTVILVTHEEDNARYAKRIVMVKDGIIQYDRPSSEMVGARLVPHETSV